MHTSRVGAQQPTLLASFLLYLQHRQNVVAPGFALLGVRAGSNQALQHFPTMVCVLCVCERERERERERESAPTAYQD